jgi:hypothetical protein
MWWSYIARFTTLCEENYVGKLLRAGVGMSEDCSVLVQVHCATLPHHSYTLLRSYPPVPRVAIDI